MYSPKIKEDQVIRLYRLKHSRQKIRPMTHMVRDAIEEYLKKEEEGAGNGKIYEGKDMKGYEEFKTHIKNTEGHSGSA